MPYLQAQQTVPPPRIFQNEDEKTFHGGLTVGANVSEVIGDAYHGYHKAGWFVGPGVAAKLNRKIVGLGVEMLYSQKGSVGVRTIYSNYVGEMFEKYYLKLNYIEVPVQLLIFPMPRAHFGIGASYSRLLNVKEEVQTDQPVYIDPSLHPFRKEDWCGLVSAKYQFWRGGFIGARYARSLKPIRTWNYVPYYYGSGHQYNMYFTFTLSYLIP